ncbi:hypothetical protein NCCP2495_03810 [Dietzia sp. NCCP-2495]|uniref:transcription termination factor Rho n=1 Tax=Dietzia sp. NCCP-2495 TaxID=2934675 RepID=UPI00222E9BAF|nr:transcription termination factor Rho [Dietzia sp. NCCP-2495]GLB62503.1 hypothetical protein NCCP2495_03810 [Dietzia sp. NCCP-2495]
MTSTETTPSAPQGASLAEMRLADLKSVAQQMGLKGLSGKRKSDLVAMIEGARSGRPATKVSAPAPSTKAAPAGKSDTDAGRVDTDAGRTNTGDSGAEGSAPTSDSRPDEGRRGDQRQDREQGGRQRRGAQDGGDHAAGQQGGGEQGGRGRNQQNRDNQNRDNQNRDQQGGGEQGGRGRNQQNRDSQNRDGQNRDQQGGGEQGGRGRNQQNRDNQNRDNQNRDQQGAEQGSGSGNQGEGNGPRGDGQNRDDDGGGRGRRSRRRRERNRGGNRQQDGDTEVREDDVLQPVAGILDVLDNYAFVRTSGYLAGSNDVYVSMNMIRRHGLRRGDAITGAVKIPRDGEGHGGNQGGGKNRQKFNPLVRIDTVNGGPVDQAKGRVDFSKLTPLYPNQRLRLETEKNVISTRVIDLIMPIGKGQRALIVSPPKAGKTTILQNIANAIATNNPECHLMVVLVDERPEEVTDMQRSVKGEVIASTFDRPPSDHTQVAELAIERAKRLVELGQDVVVLLDSITRLGRAYNNSSPASGRILSGGVDSTALYPPKRFLGAARNIENGGSLTIIATAMVETGSAGDTVIFEEFKGTGNAELKLDRRIAERRVFPAVDVGPSGTRKEELLMSPEEAGIMHKLRRVLSGLDTHQAIDLLMSQLRKTTTNYEFLLQVAKTTPTLPQDEE